MFLPFAFQATVLLQACLVAHVLIHSATRLRLAVTLNAMDNMQHTQRKIFFASHYTKFLKNKKLVLKFCLENSTITSIKTAGTASFTELFIFTKSNFKSNLSLKLFVARY